MASDDFSIKTKITLDTKNYEAGIKKAESATQKFSSSLSGVTKLLKSTFAIAGISVGTKAIVNFGKEAVKSAESANKTLNILNNTLKVTGASAWTTSEDLVKMSEEIAYSTNYTVGEIQDMQSVLLGFKNITGDTFREASDAITDMATVMGMDLKSAVQTVGKALDDPIKGLDSLRRQGFAFTEEQKEELKQLVENGEQLKAQKIILDELNTTYGGAAKSAQSSFDKQRDAIISFKETLGNQ
jgi:phage-related minor tail protein